MSLVVRAVFGSAWCALVFRLQAATGRRLAQCQSICCDGPMEVRSSALLLGWKLLRTYTPFRGNLGGLTWKAASCNYASQRHNMVQQLLLLMTQAYQHREVQSSRVGAT